jgi:hypothetical protein
MNNIQYIAFLKDTEDKLLNGESVVCFRKYQLDVLIKTYKDNLIYKYNENNQWWNCRLKDPFVEYHHVKDREDITDEQIKELFDQGFTLQYICDKLGCSITYIKSRLK